MMRVGGPPGRVRATLTIEGSNLIPDFISAHLGCLPDDSQRKGDARKHGVPCKHGAWSITDITDGEESAGALVERLLQRVPRSVEIWDALRATYHVSLAMRVLVTEDDQDFVLSPALVARLSAMGAALWIDMHVAQDA